MSSSAFVGNSETPVPGFPPPPPPPPPAPGQMPALRISTVEASAPSKRMPRINTNDSYEPPAAIQNAMLTKDKKPFTYTPGMGGKLDLSQIRSPRMARRVAKNANDEGIEGPPKSAIEQAKPAGPPSQPSIFVQPQVAVPVFPPTQSTPSINRVVPPAPLTPAAEKSSEPKIVLKQEAKPPPTPPAVSSQPSTPDTPPSPQVVLTKAPTPWMQGNKRVKQQEELPEWARRAGNADGESPEFSASSPRPQFVVIRPSQSTEERPPQVENNHQSPKTPQTPQTPTFQSSFVQQNQQQPPKFQQPVQSPQPQKFQQAVQSPQPQSFQSMGPNFAQGQNRQFIVPVIQQQSQESSSAQKQERVIPIRIEDRPSVFSVKPEQAGQHHQFIQSPNRQQRWGQPASAPIQAQSQSPGVTQINVQPVQAQPQAQQSGTSYVIPIMMEGKNSVGPVTPSPQIDQSRRLSQRGPVVNPQPEPTTPVQSRSFRVLQKITDTDTPGVETEQMRKLQLSEDDRVLMNKFKEQVDTDTFLHQEEDPRYRGAAIPSRAFRFLQNITESGDIPSAATGPRQQNQPVNRRQNRNSKSFDEAQRANLPPSEQQAQEPRKYMGSAIPSRSFRILQAMTAPSESIAEQEKLQADYGYQHGLYYYPPPPPHAAPFLNPDWLGCYYYYPVQYTPLNNNNISCNNNENNNDCKCDNINCNNNNYSKSGSGESVEHPFDNFVYYYQAPVYGEYRNVDKLMANVPPTSVQQTGTNMLNKERQSVPTMIVPNIANYLGNSDCKTAMNITAEDKSLTAKEDLANNLQDPLVSHLKSDDKEPPIVDVEKEDNLSDSPNVDNSVSASFDVTNSNRTVGRMSSRIKNSSKKSKFVSSGLKSMVPNYTYMDTDDSDTSTSESSSSTAETTAETQSTSSNHSEPESSKSDMNKSSSDSTSDSDSESYIAYSTGLNPKRPENYKLENKSEDFDQQKKLELPGSTRDITRAKSDSVIPHRLSAIYEDVEEKLESTGSGAETSELIDDQILNDDDEDVEEIPTVSVTLPLRFKFSVSENNEDVTTVFVGDPVRSDGDTDSLDANVKVVDNVDFKINVKVDGKVGLKVNEMIGPAVEDQKDENTSDCGGHQVGLEVNFTVHEKTTSVDNVQSDQRCREKSKSHNNNDTYPDESILRQDDRTHLDAEANKVNIGYNNNVEHHAGEQRAEDSQNGDEDKEEETDDDEDSGVTSDIGRLVVSDTDSERATSRNNTVIKKDKELAVETRNIETTDAAKPEKIEKLEKKGKSFYQRTQTHSRLFRLLNDEDECCETTTKDVPGERPVSFHFDDFTLGNSRNHLTPSRASYHGSEGSVDTGSIRVTAERDPRQSDESYYSAWRTSPCEAKSPSITDEFGQASGMKRPNWSFKVNVHCPRIKSTKNVPLAVKNHRAS